jgi:hypothetical protein
MRECEFTFADNNRVDKAASFHRRDRYGRRLRATKNELAVWTFDLDRIADLKHVMVGVTFGHKTNHIWCCGN